MKKISLLLLTLLLPTLTQATVVFLDLNFNPREIAEAEKAAKARHEDFVVIPDLRSPEYNGLKDIIKTSQKTLDNEKATADQKAKAHEALDQAVEKFFPTGDLLNRDNRIKNLVEAGLTKLEAKGQKMSSFIISGHHMGAGFSGDLGKFTEKQLGELFHPNPDGTPSMRQQAMSSFYLWGCYTTTKKQAQLYKGFKDQGILPNLKVVAGFSIKAPKEDKAIDYDLLNKMLIGEQQATANADFIKMLSKYNDAIKVGASPAIVLLGARCSAGGGYISTQDGKIISKEGLDSALECKADALDKFTKLDYPEFLKYLNADPYTDVPSSTEGRLRQIYNAGRAIEHCLDDIKPEQKKLYDAINNQMLALIFARNVLTHFNSALSKEISSAKSTLDSLSKKMSGVPSFPDLSGKISRQELLKQIKAYSNFLEQRGMEVRKIAGDNNSLEALKKDLNNIIRDSSPPDPIGWVENTTSIAALRHGTTSGKISGGHMSVSGVSSGSEGNNSPNSSDSKGEGPKKKGPIPEDEGDISTISK